MEAISDSLTRAMQSEIDSLLAVLEKSQSSVWIDYAIIGGFALIALLLVGKFADSGPKKLLGYLGVLIGSVIGIRWLTKRRMRGVQEAYLKIKDTFAERQKLIEEKDKNIAEYRSKIAGLRAKSKVDGEALEKLYEEIRIAKRKYQLSISETEAETILAREQAKRALSKIPEAWRTDAPSLIPPTPPMAENLSGSATEIVRPQDENPSDSLEIDGLRMRGDV
ncbi:MAG: hypothetical protein V3W14_00600 [Candidatus Neomarinimicrobiota bacterium]